MAVLRITEFTDPACPFAWSAEPIRRELLWRYGDELQWTVTLVGLSDERVQDGESGFGPEELVGAFETLRERYGMPMDTTLRPAIAASVPACRAVVAARVHAPEAERAVLRALRVRQFSGQMLDDPQTIAGAATDAGLDADAFAGWLEDPEVEQALRADMDAARRPSHAATALAHKLAPWPGGLRYTCPSYEITRTDGSGRSMAVPGFQPVAVSEVAIANLAPELERRPHSTDVEDVLRWAGEPLATAEVAAICELDRDETRQQLSRVADEHPMGQDGLWTVA
jgi:predicted DsbA family dithiol-disulfide isomerase